MFTVIDLFQSHYKRLTGLFSSLPLWEWKAFILIQESVITKSWFIWNSYFKHQCKCYYIILALLSIQQHYLLLPWRYFSFPVGRTVSFWGIASWWSWWKVPGNYVTSSSSRTCCSVPNWRSRLQGECGSASSRTDVRDAGVWPGKWFTSLCCAILCC